MKYYRVKTGYKDDEFLAIDETELETALRAQITGKVAVFKTGSVSGNFIMAITPDYQRMMGWNPDYHLKGEDYEQLGSQVNEYREAIETAKTAVHSALNPTLGLSAKKSVRGGRPIELSA